MDYFLDFFVHWFSRKVIGSIEKFLRIRAFLLDFDLGFLLGVNYFLTAILMLLAWKI
jgi:hypothetical protein